VVKFRASIELRGKTACGISVPPAIVEALAGGKRPAVNVTIRDYTYRSTIAVYSGEFLVGVSAENRAGAGVAAGDVVDVELELDREPRIIDVPGDLATALDREPVARRAFDSLSNSNKSGLVLGIKAAKAPETRQRRIDNVVAQLSGKTEVPPIRSGL